jgi:2-amino-4-hydroxy-6-hydroxymethyldihydropteridine diphosphokinase
MRAWVGVGTNLGDRWAYLVLAARALRSSPGVALVRASRVFDSAPVGPPQPRFLNAVLELETSLTPAALHGHLLAAERAAGRRRSLRWGPRTLDLDLLLHGDRVVRTPTLLVPHPALASRRFVLAPLAELCPERVVPLAGMAVAELLERAPPLDLAPVGPYPL